MKKIRVSAVSYTNSRPFVYGLQHSNIINHIELSLDNPFECAGKLIDNEADIGLIPVAALPLVPGSEIISDYCIGAVGAVNSVFIFSKKPVEEISTFRPDQQSRTSNGLARILFKHYWKIQPKISENMADAFVEIGDRTFGKTGKYPFVYDLAEEWEKFTGLPFVFATWAANKVLDPEFLNDFNEALKFGLANTDTVLNTIESREDFDMRDYLTNKVSYNLDSKKKEALAKYLGLLKEL